MKFGASIKWLPKGVRVLAATSSCCSLGGSRPTGLAPIGRLGAVGVIVLGIVGIIGIISTIGIGLIVGIIVVIIITVIIIAVVIAGNGSG
jgi:hypothetical protein